LFIDEIEDMYYIIYPREPTSIRISPLDGGEAFAVIGQTLQTILENMFNHIIPRESKIIKLEPCVD